MRGTVIHFDEQRGLGKITSDEGAVYPFHCTVLTDGSRTIRIGTAVEFDAVPGHRGRWEAAAVTRC